MEEGMATHARNDDQFMELLWETGQVSKKPRHGYESPILTESHLNRSALFPDEFNFNSNDKSFRDSQIVPVVHLDNEFIFVEDATSVPIFNSSMESEHVKKKPTLVRNRQARNEQIRPALVSNNLVQSKKLVEGFEAVRNRVNTQEEIGIVPTIGNKTPHAKATEAQSCSECSRGASNDVSYASKRGYDGADEGSINTNEQNLDEDTSDSIVPSWGKTRTKRYRLPEDRNLSESRSGRKFNKKLRALQKLVPNCNTVDKAALLDEAIDYLKTLQIQVQMMSMGIGLCMPPLMMLPRMGAALMGCNSSPFLNFPILGTAVPGIGGMTNSQIPMLPHSFPQQPIIPNLFPYFNSMPPAGISGYQFNP